MLTNYSTPLKFEVITKTGHFHAYPKAKVFLHNTRSSGFVPYLGKVPKKVQKAFDQWLMAFHTRRGLAYVKAQAQGRDYDEFELSLGDKKAQRSEATVNESKFATQEVEQPTAHKINVNCSDVKSSVKVKAKNNWFKDFYNSNLFIGAFVLSITLLACAFWMLTN